MYVVVLKFTTISPETHCITHLSGKIKETSKGIIEKQTIANIAMNSNIKGNIFIQRVAVAFIGIGIRSPHCVPLAQHIQIGCFIAQSKKMFSLLAFL